jgi:hypothetical protein
VSGQYLLTPQAPAPPTVNAVADELTQLLKLDQSQHTQVLQILNECQRQSQELKSQTRPQFQSIRDHTRGRILSILSSEQQVLYNQWTKNLDAKREKKAAEDLKQANK